MRRCLRKAHTVFKTWFCKPLLMSPLWTVSCCSAATFEFEIAVLCMLRSRDRLLVFDQDQAACPGFSSKPLTAPLTATLSRIEFRVPGQCLALLFLRSSKPESSLVHKFNVLLLGLGSSVLLLAHPGRVLQSCEAQGLAGELIMVSYPGLPNSGGPESEVHC